jgi:hypothetical protein
MQQMISPALLVHVWKHVNKHVNKLPTCKTTADHCWDAGDEGGAGKPYRNAAVVTGSLNFWPNA